MPVHGVIERQLHLLVHDVVEYQLHMRAQGVVDVLRRVQPLHKQLFRLAGLVAICLLWRGQDGGPIASCEYKICCVQRPIEVLSYKFGNVLYILGVHLLDAILDVSFLYTRSCYIFINYTGSFIHVIV